jgi:hypothetical protein
MPYPSITFEQWQDSVIDRGFDWSAWLPTGDTISSAAFTVTGGDSALVINPTPKVTSIVGAVVVFWTSGTTAGVTYWVHCQITTAAGRIDTKSMKIIGTGP